MKKLIFIIVSLLIVSGNCSSQVPVRRKKKEKTEQTQSSSEVRRHQGVDAKHQRQDEIKRHQDADVKRQRQDEIKRHQDADVNRQHQDEMRCQRQEMIIAGKGDFGKYEIGSYYNQNGKEGVVFEVDSSGKHGKIVNLKDSQDKLYWSTYYLDDLSDDRVDANSDTDGEYNTNAIKRRHDWRNRCKAADYCVKLGIGWYFPARYELFKIVQNKNVINKTLNDYNGDEIGDYWSSTETDRQSSSYRDKKEFKAFYVVNFATTPGVPQSQFEKLKVRAVAKF